VITTLTLEARRKGLKLVYEASHGTQDAFLGDAARLRQILVNLIGNAVKYTETGEVVVKTSRVLQDAQNCRILFEVKDTGIGIPLSAQSDIFDAFVQVDGTNTRKYGGTGLGLSISSQLVKLMGGALYVESTLGKGSNFYFEVSFRVAAEAAAAADEPESACAASRGCRVLVAEDNRVNQSVICRVLQKHGHSVTVAENGEDAVKRFREQPFDLVLMDLQMPVMGGLEAARRIRGFSQSRSTPIFAVTARAEESDKQNCLEAGMDEYLTKPLEVKKLLQAIDRHVPV
jgi:CheY-like chemotaxis protein